VTGAPPPLSLGAKGSSGGPRGALGHDRQLPQPDSPWLQDDNRADLEVLANGREIRHEERRVLLGPAGNATAKEDNGRRSRAARGEQRPEVGSAETTRSSCSAASSTSASGAAFIPYSRTWVASRLAAVSRAATTGERALSIRNLNQRSRAGARVHGPLRRHNAAPHGCPRVRGRDRPGGSRARSLHRRPCRQCAAHGCTGPTHLARSHSDPRECHRGSGYSPDPRTERHVPNRVPRLESG
jgi:hypothetical protein